MPLVINIYGYVVYFWSGERTGSILESVHVHVAKKQSPNGTKFWVTKSGRVVLAHNKSRIPDGTLRYIQAYLQSNVQTIIAKWVAHFGEYTLKDD